MEEDPERHRRISTRWWYSKWSPILALILFIFGCAVIILSKDVPEDYERIVKLGGFFCACSGGSFFVLKWLVLRHRGNRMIHPLKRRRWINYESVRNFFKKENADLKDRIE